MNQSIETTPATNLTEETGHWRPWHYFVLFGLTVFAIWMAVWRPAGTYASWLVMMATLTAFVAVAGHGIKGMWRGALIDEQNKLSLSRLQMLAWTTVVVSVLGVLGVARSLLDAKTGLDIEVPSTLWLLMGISTTSLIASPLMRQSQTQDPTPRNADDVMARQGTEPDSVRLQGNLVANRSSRQARWSDLFTGEKVANFGYLDISKVQMFFFTALTVITYCVAIGVSLRADALPDSLPAISDGMLMLLGISHGGYLAGKLTSGPARSA